MDITLKLLYDRCDEVGECRIWSQGCTGSGFPCISLGAAGRGKSVRRLAYELVHGPLAPGLFVYPKCRNKRCISEACLVSGTKRQYMRFASAGGAYRNPEVAAKRARAAQARSTLTPEAVAEIRAAVDRGEVYERIAERFSVSTSCIGKIAIHQTWRSTVRGSSVFA
jgi:hypothetical protein